jgi:hypothetical protein
MPTCWAMVAMPVASTCSPSGRAERHERGRRRRLERPAEQDRAPGAEVAERPSAQRSAEYGARSQHAEREPGRQR